MAPSTQSQTRHFPTRVDIPQDARERLHALLNAHLADASDLRSQLKQAHWNVKGPEFFQLHELFDLIAGEFNGIIDDLAERATSLGGYARGTVRMAAADSRLPEFPEDEVRGLPLVAALVERLGRFANGVRHAIDEAAGLGDQSTADLFTEISRLADKRLWFLEAHLQVQDEA